MSVQQSKFKEIADAIRFFLVTEDKIKPSQFVSKISEVYDAGKQAECDRFWDIFQDYGNKTNYGSAFGGFTKALFKPKYDMKVKNAMNMFHRAFINDKGEGENVDLVELLNELGITLDFSECTEFSNWLLLGAIVRIGVIDCKSLKSSFRCYYAHALKTIDKLRLYEGNGTSFMWQGCSKLTNITIEGPIEKAFDIQYSKVLTRDSIVSIMNALSDATQGLTATFSQQAVNAAFTEEEWAELVALKSNWTISLI